MIVIDWPHFVELEERVNKLSGVFPWPAEKDLGDAMDAILRVHYVYDLDLEQV